jgi:hypothetical protein
LNRSVSLHVEADAPPLVRVFYNTFKLTVQRSAGAQLVQKLDGCTFSLKSHKGPQALTVSVQQLDMTLTQGVSDKAQVILTLNFENPTDHPKVTGIVRHPILVFHINKLLSLPLPNWADSAKRFWSSTWDLKDMPSKLIINNTDENRSLELGEGPDQVEIIANAHQLESLLIGGSLLTSEVMAGKIKYRGSLCHLAALTNAGQKVLMGEVDGDNNG